MRGKLLRRLVASYHEACFTRLSRFGKCGVYEAIKDLTEADYWHFQRAADQCGRLQAKPNPYTKAQFDVFDHASSISGKTILPRPHHLHGPVAEERWRRRVAGISYVRTAADEMMRVKKAAPGSDGDYFDVEKQINDFYRDRRKLENLSAMLHLDGLDILRLHPAEFSEAFRRAEGAL